MGIQALTGDNPGMPVEKAGNDPAAFTAINRNSGAPYEPMRIDPFDVAGRIDHRHGNRRYLIDRTGVSIRQVMPKSGLPLSLAVPARAFKGVAARAVQNAEGGEMVMLELHHHDPALCVPLLIADNLDDIAADWHVWSRIMKLPMLLAGEDGSVAPVLRQLGEVMLEEPIDRRKRITTPKHRPFFLRRRKPGIVGEVTRISAAEIIARN